MIIIIVYLLFLVMIIFSSQWILFRMLFPVPSCYSLFGHFHIKGWGKLSKFVKNKVYILLIILHFLKVHVHIFTHMKMRKKIVQIDILNMSSQLRSLMYKSGGDLFLLHACFVNFVLSDLC